MCSRRCCFGRSSNRRIPCSKQKSASPELTQTNWNFQKDAGDVPHLSGEVRVVRFYVSCLLLSSSSSSSPLLLLLNHNHPRPVFPAGPQPRPSTPSAHPCRTSTTTIHAQCFAPDRMPDKMSEIEWQMECQINCQR